MPKAKAKIPLGLIGMLGLVAAIEGVERRHANLVNDYVAQSWRYSAEAAHRAAVGADVLYFGDSLVKVGLVPDLIEERTGRSGFNLAVFGGQAPSSYFLLKKAIDSGAKPKAIVADFHGNLLAAAPRSSVPYWGELASNAELGGLFRETGDIEAAFRTLLAGAIPSTIDRREIRFGIASLVSGVPWLTLRERRAELRNWGLHLGGHMVPVASPGSFEPPPDPPRPVVWRPDRVNETYLRRFLALARDRHIPVFWLIPPTTRGWTARRERIGIEPGYTAFARLVLEEFPNLVVVDGRDSGYPDILFRDATHANRVGAAGISSAMASVLNDRLRGENPGADRWVRLPPFSEPPGHWTLEDVDQSAIALGGDPGVRRR